MTVLLATPSTVSLDADLPLHALLAHAQVLEAQALSGGVPDGAASLRLTGPRAAASAARLARLTSRVRIVVAPADPTRQAEALAADLAALALIAPGRVSLEVSDAAVQHRVRAALARAPRVGVGHFGGDLFAHGREVPVPLSADLVQRAA
ncbi:hypothetical protein [Serinibacter salmoneus]|uniref:Uncharacterized protein n=1 Tax=Serinibacter salmoneus TaxID=556530 RepID=A0A2A9CYP8_9MICO|nr:hypothetical protein [Serinibacter salmoneus]PFG18740.1 hypothetical protein ATL40_0283 [Serinibacter salmoneus]